MYPKDLNRLSNPIMILAIILEKINITDIDNAISNNPANISNDSFIILFIAHHYSF